MEQERAAAASTIGALLTMDVDTLSSEFARDSAATAVVFGLASAAWFGWAQEAPPPAWRRPLAVAAFFGIASAAAGGLLMWRTWDSGSAIDAASGPDFGVVVAIEFAIAALGSTVLIRLGRKDLIAAWVGLVVGVHFFFLAPLLQMKLLHVVAALLTVGAIVSVPLARSRGVTKSAMAGLIVGGALLLAALVSLMS